MTTEALFAAVAAVCLVCTVVMICTAILLALIHAAPVDNEQDEA